MVDKFPNRKLLVGRLAEDLIGPRTEYEILQDRPSDVYLTGVLWPQLTEMSGEDDDALASGSSGGSSDNAESSEAEAIPTVFVQKPSVAGISFCTAYTETATICAEISFGRYALEIEEDGKKNWIRKDIRVSPTIVLSSGSQSVDLNEIDALAAGVILYSRCIRTNSQYLVTLTLINNIAPGDGRDDLEAATLFQTALRVIPLEGTKLIPKPSRQSDHDEELDDEERSNLLLFRDVVEFAAGHVCSARWGKVTKVGSAASTEWVAMSWLPSVIVPGVSAKGHKCFENMPSGALSALSLSNADDATLKERLSSLCSAYGEWIKDQHSKVPKLEAGMQETATANLQRCKEIQERIGRAIDEILGDPKLKRAFQLSNLAMHIQHGWDPEKAAYGPLSWRPFQLAFLLLSAVSTLKRDHTDRQTMDLLWFPTGGGKTEAYLALIAMLAFYRRMSAEASEQCGVAALMRYTLRLLTTQQFARSAAMMMACELIRSGKIEAPDGPDLMGDEPFSIGLWVGGDATPNRLSESYASLQGSKDVASPKQLALCPACHSKVLWSQSTTTSPVTAACPNSDCLLFGNLPVWTVDEDIYRVRPTLLVGTVDKFAQIVRRPETNGLFGVSKGAPPDLIIQDELHLISGPLGTVAGSYEAAFDILFSKDGIPPKVIGSTATIRRASEQVRDLFDRRACQFPPAAIDHHDSGFAVLDPESTGRRYIGISTAGRSAKFTLQAVAASLLQSAAQAFTSTEDSDPYWTLVGYFNSLRELGGALVLMQDDVTDSIELYRRERGEPQARAMKNVEELTSRRTQEEILEMLDRLAIKAGEAGSLDTVLATNMVSVGVDIPRLGLMIVNGQPKTTSEYIQATSRVGRGGVSGLVVAILNNAKARDRSHFETFSGWHQALYRDVEATSVTPFASRSRDRSLHAALVAAVRHLAPGMLDRPDGLDGAALTRAHELIELIVARASRIDPEERAVRAELLQRLDQWLARSPSHYWQDYQVKKSLLQSAEVAAWKKALGKKVGSAWPTLNSMRSVEAGTPFKMVPGLRGKIDGK